MFRVIKFVVTKDERLSKQIARNIPSCNFSAVMKAIRCKNVRVCGKKISADLEVKVGDEVAVYIDEKDIKKAEIVFEDENILVANKPRKLETTTEGDASGQFDGTLHAELEREVGIKLYAVHRLDRNTAGLVVFAKNETAKKSLDEAIKNRKLKKYYISLVSGVPKVKEEKLTLYLKKDEAKSRVYVSDKPVRGFEKTQTDYKIVRTDGKFSVLEVMLHTGKTHQIRASLAHIGLPIVGDEKYGVKEVNRAQKLRYQCLFAKKLVFQFEENDALSYLNGKTIELDDTKIDFLSKI